MTGNDKIIFVSDEHKNFYMNTLKRMYRKEVYQEALCYCLGICEDTRNHIEDIYDFKEGMVKPECLHQGWQTSGSARVVRLAFNLYCNGMPSVNSEENEDKISECGKYSVEDIFCCSYAPFFWQAVKIRYPEYAVYNRELYSMLGSRD